MTAYLMRVMAGQRKPGKCRDCRQAIEFRLNTNGRWVPFDAGAQPLHTEQDPATHVRHDMMSRDHTHFARCPKRPSAVAAAGGAR
jgi:hypothetical protein